jgi:hypothetical protein
MRQNSAIDFRVWAYRCVATRIPDNTAVILYIDQFYNRTRTEGQYVRDIENPFLIRIARAISIGSPTAKNVKSILQKYLEQLTLPLNEASDTEEKPTPIDHDNMCGPKYYH